MTRLLMAASSRASSLGFFDGLDGGPCLSLMSRDLLDDPVADLGCPPPLGRVGFFDGPGVVGIVDIFNRV